MLWNWGKNKPKYIQSKIDFNFDLDFLEKLIKVNFNSFNSKHIYVNIYPKYLDHEYVNELHK